MDFSQDIGENVRYCMSMCNRIINTDISEDFTLADYNPEIRRVLCIKESVLPPAKFISGNKLDVNGVIDYTLVYVGNDGKIHSAPLSAEYGFSLPLENASDFEMNEGVNAMVHSEVESSTVRVLAPRKLQLRSHMHSNVNAWGKKSYTERMDGVQDISAVQRLRKNAKCAEILCESSDIVSLEDEYVLPSPECRVTFADSTTVITDCNIEGELVRITGEVVVKMLIANDNDGSFDSINRKIKFDAESDAIGLQTALESFCRINGNVTDVSLNVEDGRVKTQVNLVLEVCIAQNKEICYTEDMYSIAQKSEVSVRNEALPIICANQNYNFSQNERVDFEEANFDAESRIVEAFGSAIMQEVEVKNGRLILRGNSKYSIICDKDGEYSCCDVKVPIKFECDCDGEAESFDAIVNVLDCRVKADSGALNIESELGIACTVMGINEINMLQCAAFGDNIEQRSGEWIVCYARMEDDVWHIAKRYGVRCEDVKGDPQKEPFVMIEK